MAENDPPAAAALFSAPEIGTRKLGPRCFSEADGDAAGFCERAPIPGKRLQGEDKASRAVGARTALGGSGLQTQRQRTSSENTLRLAKVLVRPGAANQEDGSAGRQNEVLLHVGDPTTMFMATDCPTMTSTAMPTEVATPRGAALQQPVVGRGGLLLEQPTSAKATNLQKPPLLQQQHVLANGQPPPDPDSIPVLEPITAEEHFHAEMLHQTIKQTALLQDMLSAQQRIAQAAERQAQAAEEQSHALSQLALFLIENHRSNKNSGANLSSSGVDDCSCSESATTLSITPEILQVEHST
nr:uncharacterized protein LOC119166716 isoform X3 [Rhipicephalus microplus]